METHKQAKCSKSLDPDEIKEALMDEESDEELEDRDEVERVFRQTKSTCHSSNNSNAWNGAATYSMS